MLRVSVVIPVYNEEKYIGKCLAALFSQKVKADEIIVVDNNCTDRTIDIVKKFDVKIVRETKQGMIPARNRGFDEAKYEIIAKTDADAIVPNDWIQRIKINFKDETLTGLAGTAHFYDFPIHNIFQHSQWQNKAMFALIRHNIKQNTLHGPNMAVRKSSWQRVRNMVCLDDRLVHEDTDLAIHLGKHGKIRIDQKLIVNSSFRRYKKIYTYYEYMTRLFRTFSIHKQINT